MTQRAKTTPASTPGSFAPHTRSEADVSLASHLDPLRDTKNRSGSVRSARRTTVDGSEVVAGIIHDRAQGRMLVVDAGEHAGERVTFALNIDQTLAGNVYMHEDPDIAGSGGAAFRGDMFADVYGAQMRAAVDSDFKGRPFEKAAEPEFVGAIYASDYHRNGSVDAPFTVTLAGDVALVDFNSEGVDEGYPAFAVKLRDLANGEPVVTSGRERGEAVRADAHEFRSARYERHARQWAEEQEARAALKGELARKPRAAELELTHLAAVQALHDDAYYERLRQRDPSHDIENGTCCSFHMVHARKSNERYARHLQDSIDLKLAQGRITPREARTRTFANLMARNTSGQNGD